MNGSMKNLVSGDAAFVALWHEICDEDDRLEREWISGLRAAGVKAAHPDDGWVDRRANTVCFVYPQFNDGARVGDLVALGYHFTATRIVRLTGHHQSLLGTGRWSFEEEQR